MKINPLHAPVKMQPAGCTKLLVPSICALLLLETASAETKNVSEPEETGPNPELLDDWSIDRELANWNLLKVSPEDSIFFTPAFVDGFAGFSLEDPVGSRFEHLYDLLNDAQVAREIGAMQDLFYLGIIYFDPLEGSPLTEFGGGGFLGDLYGGSSDTSRGTPPPVGFGIGGIASSGGMTAPQYELARFGGNSRYWSTFDDDGGTSEYFGGSDSDGRATGRTRFGSDGSPDNTIILEHRADGASRETHANHRSGESTVMTRYASGASTFSHRNSEGEVFVAKGSDGHVQKAVTYRDENGEPVTAISEDSGSGDTDADTDTDTTGNPGDAPTESERRFAQWLFSQHALGRSNSGQSVRNPNRVNPGDPDDKGNAAPRIDLGDAIVINPDVNEVIGGGRELSAEVGAAMRRYLREKVGGLVNPPGPAEKP
jgi:hypothetical protein